MNERTLLVVLAGDFFPLAGRKLAAAMAAARTIKKNGSMSDQEASNKKARRTFLSQRARNMVGNTGYESRDAIHGWRDVECRIFRRKIFDSSLNSGWNLLKDGVCDE